MAVRVADGLEKEVILRSDESRFFTEPHYDGFPAALVMLAAIDVPELKELVTNAWRYQAPRDPQPERAPRDVATAPAAERDANLALLSGPTAADLERAGRHPEYGMIALRVMVNAWAAHDPPAHGPGRGSDDAGVHGTGPFRFRFADHDVEDGGEK